LGAFTEYSEGAININSNGVKPKGNVIHCGESGLSVRMFTPIAALHYESIYIHGHGSLTKRPLSFFTEVLPNINVECKSNNGFLPLEVKGPLQPKDITVDGSLSSQFLTGLLFAYAAADATNVTIEVINLASKPYIDLTLKLMEDFELKLPVNENYERFVFKHDTQQKWDSAPLHYTVEGDWSGAAFLLVGGAINGDITVKGLDAFSTQADKAILQALMQANALLSIEEHQIRVQTGKLKALHFNATHCPDLFPPLVALAAYCEGTSVIEGVHRLTHKESNRALTLQQEFGKLGVDITLQEDLMIIKGDGKLSGAKVSSHGDHRIAMACAIAALQAVGDVIVDGAEAVDKSYPEFWKDLKSLQQE
jgi:3-phosphoshikimate 1-carboxyvinyltransferase